MTKAGKGGNPPISSGGTGHSMVAGLDSFPSAPMNRPSPRVVQTMTDKPEEKYTHCPFQVEPLNRQLELL